MRGLGSYGIIYRNLDEIVSLVEKNEHEGRQNYMTAHNEQVICIFENLQNGAKMQLFRNEKFK